MALDHVSKKLISRLGFTFMKRGLYHYDCQELLYKIMQKYAAPSAFYKRTGRKRRCFGQF